jgi:hypothetical protein
MARTPHAKFAQLYEQALKFQAAGDFPRFTQLIRQAYASGLSREELSIIGALTESTLNASLSRPSGPR